MSTDKNRYPIIFDKIKQIMTLGLDSGVSSKIQLEDLLRKKSASIKVPLVCQSESYNNLVMDVLIKGAVILIDIKPALKLTNLCPLPFFF